MACDDVNTVSRFGLENTFVKFYGTNNPNTGVKSLATDDGGYIVAGYTHLGDTTYTTHLFKTNQLGNEEWSLMVDTSSHNIVRDMIIDDDGSFLLLLAQFTENNGVQSEFDIRLVRVSAIGEVSTSIVYDSDGVGTYNELGSGLIKGADGGYFVVGSTDNTSGGDLDMYVMKLDASLGVVWDKIYGNVNGLRDAGKSIIEDASGNLVWLGTEEVTPGDVRVRMVKTNSLGNILWDFNYPVVESNNVVTGVSDAGGMITLNNSYVFTGSHASQGVLLVSVDENGQEEWFKTFASVGDEEANGLTLATDNTIAIAGESSSGDILLIKTDIQGTLIWNNTLGGAGSDVANAVEPAPDGGLIVTGTISFDADQMITLTRTNDQGVTSE